MKRQKILLNTMDQSRSNIFLIVGEKSGDLYGGQLIKELLKKKSNLKINFWGGYSMQQAGGNLLQHYKEYNFMGLDEVLKNLITIQKKMNLCKQHILETKPNIIILIDFPGFNMRIAKFSKKNGIKVIYFIPPKVWAWNAKRMIKIKKYVDLTFSILPFELSYFKKHNINIFYYGNPLTKIIDSHNFIEIKKNKNYQDVVSLLPGSRISEISRSIVIFKELIKSMPKFMFYVAAVDNVPESIYSSLQNLPNVKIYNNRTYDIVKSSKVAVVVSGTASLEVALLNVPQIVVYKTSYFTYLIAKMVLKIKYISLVNLILSKSLVKEFIQQNFNFLLISNEIVKIVDDNNYTNKIKKGYKELRNILGSGDPITQIASSIIKMG